MKSIHIAIVLIVFVLVGGGVFLQQAQSLQDGTKYTPREDGIASTSTGEASRLGVAYDVASSTIWGGLTDAQFEEPLHDPSAKVLARGDVNNDGFEDAVVQEVRCGASCSTGLQIVLNKNNMSAELFVPTKYANFEPAYRGSSALKSNITNVSIQNGIIYLTGTALGCGNACTEIDTKITKTVSFKFDGKEVVEVSTRAPEEIVLEYYNMYLNYKDGKTKVNNSTSPKYVTQKIVNAFNDIIASLEPDRGLNGDPFVCAEEGVVTPDGIRVTNVQVDGSTAVVKLSGFAVGGVSLIYENGWKINEIKCQYDGRVSL